MYFIFFEIWREFPSCGSLCIETAETGPWQSHTLELSVFLHLPGRWYGPTFLNHHSQPPRVHTSRNLRSVAEMRFNPGDFDMGCRLPTCILTVEPNTHRNKTCNLSFPWIFKDPSYVWHDFPAFLTFLNLFEIFKVFLALSMHYKYLSTLRHVFISVHFQDSSL